MIRNRNELVASVSAMSTIQNTHKPTTAPPLVACDGGWGKDGDTDGPMGQTCDIAGVGLATNGIQATIVGWLPTSLVPLND
jgi:hypothetical protein